MENRKKPAVATVEGLCLGGGFELALTCHACIAAPRTQLRLSDLRLGVLSGSVGTKHPPRLIGLSKSVEMMMTSKPIMLEEGKNLGVIDVVVPSIELLKVDRQWALDIIESRKPWVCYLHRTEKIGFISEAHEVLKLARQPVKQTTQNMPQHLACLDVIKEGIIHGGYKGIIKEAKVFQDLILSDTSRGLIHVFFAQRATSKSAHFLANLRVDIYRIDALITRFGLPIGPFQLQDLAGYKVVVVEGKEYRSAFFDRVFTSKLLDLLIKSGQNGKNNGKGYYIYKKGENPKPYPTVLLIIEKSRRLTNIMPGGKPISIIDQEIVEMILFPIVNEACCVLDDGIRASHT
ncbi:hypothetical protein CQW23_15288 [Capsicum baccatum]|uniref:3-hydroxyacyl-CoA dehydrogenase C-terminal domain-containing protein n=1 Tax=Capsicum baccatum TaxID=33114 RepID=A0A2G2WLU6_CAPBA|nr:hypothetical protein CQW23_15288 [Capsicum baccatum]